jgi:hypothetical protein
MTLLAVRCGGPGSSVEVSHNFEKTTDFTSYKTYAWADEGPNQEMRIAGSADVDLHGTITKAVEEQMAAKGLVQVNVNPDILVKYHTGTPTSVNLEELSWTDSQAGGEGQLTIDLVDRESQQVVWRGSAQGAVLPNPNQTRVYKNINRAVKAIFEHYPPPASR